MRKLLPVLLVCGLFTAGCATHPVTAYHPRVLQNVRTTAYTQTEPGGAHNACGGWLSASRIHSAASDWSRYPVGTLFQIVSTGEICQIDDYGSALVGTDTIDLYKDSRASMHQWGVRNVEIKILRWGSPRLSLEILAPRTRNAHVARMVFALRQQTQGIPLRFKKVES